MRMPTPTATAATIQRHGAWATRMIGLVAHLELPTDINMPPERPLIVAGNHRSLLDVFCAAAACHSMGGSGRFLVQATYFSTPVLGRWLKSIGCIPLNSKTKEAAFVEATEALQRGELLGIMPEGRLVPPDQRTPQTGQLRTGVSELARATNAVVRPISFHHTDVVWPKDRWPRRVRPKPTVTIRFGPDLSFDTDDHVANTQVVDDALTELLNGLDQEKPH